MRALKESLYPLRNFNNFKTLANTTKVSDSGNQLNEQLQEVLPRVIQGALHLDSCETPLNPAFYLVAEVRAYAWEGSHIMMAFRSLSTQQLPEEP